MKTHLVALIVWLAVATCIAAEPERAKGLSVHMLPDRVAQIDGHSGGFTVNSQNYTDAAQLIAYFRTLPVAMQENGIWVVTTSPSAYSESERAKLKALITLCDDKKIPVFTCRGSDLPKGWKRSEVPVAWSDSRDSH